MVLDAECFAPAGAGHTFDDRRPPHTRPDTRPAWGKIHHLSCADAQHGVEAGLDQESQVGIGTQTPIRPEHVPWMSARVDRLPVGQIVREQGRDHKLEEESGAGMEEPQEPRHGNAAPRPLHVRLAEGILSRRGTRAWSSLSHRQGRCDDHATARHPRRIVGQHG